MRDDNREPIATDSPAPESVPDADSKKYSPFNLPKGPDGPMPVDLSPTEAQLLMGIRGEILTGKERVYDLQVALEKVKLLLMTAEKQFDGALASLSIARFGRQGAHATPDFRQLIMPN